MPPTHTGNDDPSGKRRGARAGKAGLKGGKGGGKGGKPTVDKTVIKTDLKMPKRQLLDKIHKLSIGAGKCARFNKTGCDAMDCGWSHDCAVCQKPGCAAWKHPELQLKE